MIGRVYKLYLGFKVCYVEENECLFLIYYFWIKDDVYIIKICFIIEILNFLYVVFLCWYCVDLIELLLFCLVIYIEMNIGYRYILNLNFCC